MMRGHSGELGVVLCVSLQDSVLGKAVLLISRKDYITKWDERVWGDCGMMRGYLGERGSSTVHPFAGLMS